MNGKLPLIAAKMHCFSGAIREVQGVCLLAFNKYVSSDRLNISINGIQT